MNEIIAADVVDAVIIEPGDGDEPISVELAQHLTEQMRQAINTAIAHEAHIWGLLQRAYAGQIWVPMGYSSFGEWGQAELSADRLGRSKAEIEGFAALYAAGDNNPAGIPQTQVALALGINERTYRAQVARLRQPARELEVAKRLARPPAPKEAVRLHEIAELTRQAEAEGRTITQPQLASIIGVSQSTISGDLTVLDAMGGRPPELPDGLQPIADAHKAVALLPAAAGSSLAYAVGIDPSQAWLRRFADAVPRLADAAALLRSALTESEVTGSTAFVMDARKLADVQAARAFHDLYLFLRDVLGVDASHALATGEVRYRDPAAGRP